jgi:hypothetical protein
MEGSIALDVERSRPAARETVAIVIPVYKHSVLLAEAIESALGRR